MLAISIRMRMFLLTVLCCALLVAAAPGKDKENFDKDKPGNGNSSSKSPTSTSPPSSSSSAKNEGTGSEKNKDKPGNGNSSSKSPTSTSPPSSSSSPKDGESRKRPSDTDNNPEGKNKRQKTGRNAPAYVDSSISASSLSSLNVFLMVCLGVALVALAVMSVIVLRGSGGEKLVSHSDLNAGLYHNMKSEC